jgi:hypothetical protein
LQVWYLICSRLVGGVVFEGLFSMTSYLMLLIQNSVDISCVLTLLII